MTLIKRADAIDACCRGWNNTAEDCIRNIKELPSADIEGIDPRLHIECKVGYSYKTIYDFTDQAIRDSKDGEIPIVNCKMDRKPWLCVMLLDDFIEIWNGKDKKER